MCARFTFIHFVAFLYVFNSVCVAQNYYGSRQFGHIEILNDSTCTICFIIDPNINNSMGGKMIDTCSIEKSGDTIYISTRIRQRFEAVDNNCFCDSSEKTPMVFKTYYQNYNEINYHLGGENVCYSCDDLIDFTDCGVFEDGEIVVVHYFVEYVRVKWIYGKDTHVLKYNWVDGCCLDRFPLLIKGNRLKPINTEKNEQCWIENGFYFSTMKRSRKEKSFDVIGRWSIGLRGLPNGYNIPENKFSKHRD